MNLAVYCGSNESPNPVYKERTEELGKWMAENGHTLVYGASDVGLMGAISRSVKKAGGYVIGVEPDGIPLINSNLADYLDEEIHTKDIADRRSVMIEKADTFIALPGSFGTLDEVSEVMSLLHLNLVKGKMILYNIQGYYEPLRDMLKKMVAEGFLSERCWDEVKFASCLDDIIKEL